MQMSPQFAAISFVTLIIFAHWAIHRLGDWLYPDRMGLDSESTQRDRWTPLTSANRRVTQDRQLLNWEPIAVSTLLEAI
jgi:hypothetical protein